MIVMVAIRSHRTIALAGFFTRCRSVSWLVKIATYARQKTVKGRCRQTY
jgi:hypothetical protein